VAVSADRHAVIAFGSGDTGPTCWMGKQVWIIVRGHGRTHQTINPGSQQIEELRAKIRWIKG
jgi:hypothetical protein